MASQAMIIALTLVLSWHTVAGFSTLSTGPNTPTLFSGQQCSTGTSRVPSKLLASSRNIKDDDDDDEEDEDEESELIANENLFRELMGGMPDEPEEKKKGPPKGKKKSIKKPHDNRDQLPFLVQVMTPPEEPYEQHMLAKKRSKKSKKKGDDLGVVGETLGEFAFEKHTTSGDKIEIDGVRYVVQEMKCQYRYAGAQKFEMYRKVLQVKPMERAMQEDYIMRQWNASPSAGSE